MISLPQTQVLDSSTFSAPPIHDSSLTLPDLYDWHSVNSPDHPLFVFDQGHGNLREITYAEAVQAIHRAAHLVQSLVNEQDGVQPVIAIFCSSDFVTYFCTILGILRAGLVVFPLSSRNSALAVANLLEKTATTHVLITPDPGLETTLKTALSTFESSHITQSHMPVFEDIFHDGPFEPFPKRQFRVEDPAMILHSSGSTTFPKPIVWSHGSLLETGRVPWYGEVDLCGVVMCTAAIPMFHGMGITQMIIDATCGLTMSVFKPSYPAMIPTPTNVFETMVATRTELVGCVPVFIEAWSKIPEYVAVMKKMKGLIYGGGPLNKAVGDYLASEGIKIHVTYASTEGGVMSAYVRENPGMHWEYFRFSGHTRPVFIPYTDDAHEVVMKAHEGHNPRVINATIMGEDAYGTSDLLEPHPTEPDLWKVIGRADDQIMLSTGEKTNPGPLETILGQDPHVRSAVIFGRGRFQNGVIIDPHPGHAFDADNLQQLVKFRTLIWPSILKVNEFAPTHSRIFKEMIIVSVPSKPFSYSAKGTVRRTAVIGQYADEINNLYELVTEKSVQKNIVTPQDWTLEESLKFVRVIVSSVVTLRVEDSDDLFQHGCDSLQATWIRNIILKAIRESHGHEGANRLSENVVYQNPTVARLAVAVSAAIRDASMPDAAALMRTAQEAQEMADRYSSKFPVKRSPSLVTSPSPTIAADYEPPYAPGCVSTIFSRFSRSKKPSSATNPGAQTLKLSKRDSQNLSLMSKPHSLRSKMSYPKLKPPLPGSGDVILVTGTTGGFGSNILYHLATSPNVTRIYALNRRSPTETLLQRQKEALRWADDVDILSLESVKLVECNLSEDILGLDPDLYEEIRSSVTHIIHNAWRVDFNLSLASFESNIRGLRNLVDMALTSRRPEPPRIIFISSIGIFQRSLAKGGMAEEEVPNPQIAAGSGYSESKWIGERLLMVASRNTPLKPVIVRLGQITGNRSGYWNQREWFPAIIKSALTIRCLPDTKGAVSWIPAFEASKALVEMRNSTQPVLHIAHPNPIPWASLMKPIAEALNVPLVPYADWFHALEDSLHDVSTPAVEHMRTNPALRLISFFRCANIQDEDKEPLGLPRLSTRQATRVSKVMQSEVKRLQPEDALKWLEAWKSSGFLSY